jgi:HD-like signal output (HDOD) protein
MSLAHLPKLNHAAVRTCLKDRQNLPTLPNTFTMLVQAIADPETSLLELAEIIACDPTLTASVLRVANSSYSTLGTPVSDLPTAILNLGVFEIRRTALGVGSVDVFGLKGNPSELLKNMWLHSLTTGFISQQIANIGRFDFVDEAYLLGLLHDLGKLFFVTSYPSAYASVHEVIASGSEDALGLEVQVFGLNHVDAAADLCKHWNLRGKLEEVIINHHSPMKVSTPNRPLALCVAIANVLAHQTMEDKSIEPLVPTVKEWLSELGRVSFQPDLLNLEDLTPIAMLELERARYFEELTGSK